MVFADRVLKPLMLLEPSTTTALPADTLPAVTSSIVSSSLSDIFALPITNDPPEVMLPELVIVPSPETFPLVSKV